MNAPAEWVLKVKEVLDYVDNAPKHDYLRPKPSNTEIAVKILAELHELKALKETT